MEDLPGILQLQKENLRPVLTKTEQQEEGFVTIQHDLPLLKKMNSPFPHTIAIRGDEVVLAPVYLCEECFGLMLAVEEAGGCVWIEKGEALKHAVAEWRQDYPEGCS